MSYDEVENFCGNMLMVSNEAEAPVLVMSKRAKESLSPSNRTILEESYKNIVAPDLEVIETIGGGSARCMLAELF